MRDTEEKTNLVELLDEDERAQIARQVHDDFDRDKASRQKRVQRWRDIQKMYAMLAEKKNFPFRNAANIKTPALTGPILQIEARVTDMILPPDGNVLYVTPETQEGWGDANAAERFANHYIRRKMPYFPKGTEDLAHDIVAYGIGVRRTYYSPADRAIRCDFVPHEDFVVAYEFRSQDPSLSDVPRYTYVQRLTFSELERAAADGYYDISGVDEHDEEEEDVSINRQETRKIDGINPSRDEKNPKRPILEQHFSMRLPAKKGKKGHPSMDGEYHYVVATVDAWSDELLRLSVREEDDPEDRLRFDKQLAAHQQYLSDLEAYALAIAAAAGPEQATDGLAPLAPAPPEPPLGVDVDGPILPKPPRKRQVCFFTVYSCFTSDGFYSLGYGDLLYGITMAMDTLLNQHVDAGTLRNAPTLLKSLQMRFPAGQVTLQPGTVIDVDGPMQSVREGMMWLEPPAADPTTMPIVRMLDTMKDAMVGSASTFSGDIPGSNQTASGVEMLIEQALMPISSLGQKIKRCFQHDLEKIWRCFGVFLEPTESMPIIDENGEPQEIPIRPEMFSPMAHLEPASDPRVKSQRIKDHQALFSYVLQNPLLQNTPEIGQPVLRQLTEDGLRIFPDGARLARFLRQPPQPQGPPPPRPHWEEDAAFLRDEDSQVHPDDDDDAHIVGHDTFAASPAAQRLTREGRDKLERHTRLHQAAKIQKGMSNGTGQGDTTLPLAPGGVPPTLA
jgi:hypothetical protein